MTENLVYLSDGREIRTEVQRFYDSGTATFEGRTITVERLPEPYQHRGYGEVVHIKLLNGKTLGAVLHPLEYEHHLATVPVGNIETTQARRQYPGDSITESKSPSILAIYDQALGQWREMIDEERKKLNAIQDPFDTMTADDFAEALKPENWKEVYQRLHTPTFEAILQDGRLTLLFPDDQRKQFGRSDVEALTLFLDQYAGVSPLTTPTDDPFEGFEPVKVELASIETEVQEPAIVRGYYPSEDAMTTGHLWGVQHDDDTHEVFFFMENTTTEKIIKETGAIHYRFPDGCVLILHDGMARTEEEVKAD